MQDGDEILLSEGGKEIIAILKDLDNPHNIIYHSALHALTLKKYVSIEYGKNPDGSNGFKFNPSPAGQRLIDRFDYITKKEER